ncbi:MAG: SusC/RagA family TonB-linked outer membrane protein, partial [Bacteroidia bacterium]
MMLLFSLSLFAQDGYTLSGKVSNADNVPLTGVTVTVANTTKGAITDDEGKFRLEVTNGDVLKFSYLGYASQSITITDQKTLNVTLVEADFGVDEVVVVGYGTRKKSHNTGAITQVDGDAVAAIQANRVDDALAGKMAGVLIQNQSGEPGADPKIQIRAASSITGNSNPLIVVDGYPISGSLATVNPNDVESIEVLKDAASAAIYGSRGANGVILVTTKKGKAGKTQFSYDAYTSVSQKYRDNINMTASEWADYADASIANGNWDVAELESIAPGFVDFKINGYRNSPDVVAIEDHIFGTGSTQNHNFSMSGGNDDTKFFASVGYQDVDGVVRTQAFRRLNARLNIDSKLGERFSTGLSFNGFTSDRSALEHSMRDILRGASIHPIYHTANSIAFVQDLNQKSQDLGIRVSRQGGVNPTQQFDNGVGGGGIHPQSIYDLQPGDAAWDWHYGRAGNGIGGSSNPGTADLIDNKSNTEQTYFGNMSSYLDFQIVDGLNLKTVLGGDIRTFTANQHYLAGGDNNGELKDTYLDQQDVRRTSLLSETTLNFNKVLNDKHDISALVGVEFQKNFIEAINVAGNNVSQLLGEPLNYALLAPEDVTVSERDETIHRESLFGRVQYAYDNRYLASVSVRRDGDSRFGANNKYEVFPAVSLGWNIHNEAFYNSDFLTNAKLRFSYGSLGTTSNLGAYNSLSILNPGTSVLGNAFLIPNDVANPNLTWQTNTETNFGINLGFLRNKFTLSVDYYTSNIENILIDQSVSEVFGTSSVKLNSGDVKSSGIELGLGAVLVNTSNFRWNAGANLSTVKTEITDLGPLTQLPDQIYGTSGRGAVYRNYVGGEIGELWGLETAGWVDEKH